VSDELDMVIRPDAGGERGRVVADEHTAGEAWIFLGRMDADGGGVTAAPSSSYGVFADFGGISGGGEDDDGGEAISAGVFMRVCGDGEGAIDRDLVEGSIRWDFGPLRIN
jgi:hypothetical protein